MTTIEKIQSFFREVYVELRKTSWLTRKEVLRYTIIVLAVTIVVAAVLGTLDYFFSSILQSLLLR